VSQISFASNINSLKAQRRLNETSQDVSKVYERLSSGLRINRASDDAAGLSITSTLSAAAKVYQQGIRNLNDGLSILSIADGTVDQLSQIAVRLKELAEQAANGTYGTAQRQALDVEAQTLADEYFRISRSAKFNGVNLFDGSIQGGIRIQAGYDVEGSIQSIIGGALGTGTFGGTTTYAMESAGTSDVALADLNGDGNIDIVSGGTGGGVGYTSVRLGNGDGSFQSSVSYTNGGTNVRGVILGDLNNDGILDMVAGGVIAGSGAISVRLGTGNGTFGSLTTYASESGQTEDVQLGDFNGDGFLDVASAGNSTGNVRLGRGDGTFGAITSIASGTSIHKVAIADITNDGVMDLIFAGDDGAPGETRLFLGRGNGTFKTSTVLGDTLSVTYDIEAVDLNGDGNIDLIGAGPTGTGGAINVRLGNGNGTFKAESTYSMGNSSSVEQSVTTGDLNGDGILDVLSVGYSGGSGILTVRLGNGNGTFQGRQTYTVGLNTFGAELADLNRDGVLDVVTAQDGASGQAGVALGLTREGISPILPFSLKTLADARQALPKFDDLINRLASQRGVIGAFQSRLAVASNVLGATRENYLAAGSRINDVDMAEEAAGLARIRILQDASTFILAQANSQPQLALSLLQE